MTSWYRRWDLLMHLVRHNQENAVVADPQDEKRGTTMNQKTPKFFIGEDSEMTSAEDDEDDMEDIVVLVNPLYHGKNRSIPVQV